MDSSLAWLVGVISFFLFLFVVYLILSTCMGPPLIRACRAWLGSHYNATTRDNWDGGRGGYRSNGGIYSRPPAGLARGWGFEAGRGGAEGYEMASLGDDDL